MTAGAPRTVAIIGAGASGRSFARACAQAGFQVVLEDVMPARLRHAEAEFATLGHAVELVGTVEDAVRDADLAVDFVPDELESKLEIWSMIDRMAPPKTILCTPSEALSVTDLASCTYRADRCAMVRGGIARVSLDGAALRLLVAAPTTAETSNTAAALFRSLGAAVSVEHDPDLPMLLKNMHASSLV